MKNNIYFPPKVVILFYCLFILNTHAQKEPVSPSPHFQLYTVSSKVQFVAFPLHMAQRYIDVLRTTSPKTPSAAINAYNQIQADVEAKKGILVGTAQVTTKPGKEARGQSTQEFIYLSQYNDKSIPEFVPREIGTILTINPIVGDDMHFIDVNLVAEYTTLGRTKKSEVTLPSSSKPISIEIPEFIVCKTSCNIYVVDSIPVLLGVYNGMNKDGSKDENTLIFSILTVEINRLSAP